MVELLQQALNLTLSGMGVTFAALGVLVLGMYALTALFPEKPRQEQEEDVFATPEPREVSADATRYQAAAAAVAVALAAMQAESIPAGVTPYWPPAGLTDEWTPYVRNQHLAQRAQYTQTAWRR